MTLITSWSLQSAVTRAAASESDNFNRSNGSLTSPWMVGYTGQQTPAINGNAVRSPTAGGAQAIAIYNATLPNDQWGSVTISTIQGAGTVSAFVKLRHADSPTASGYEFRAYRNNATERSEIAKRVAGTSTTLISENVTTWASGDTLDAEVQGTTLILSKITSGVKTQILTITDSTFSSGKAGFAITSSILGDGMIDNFSAGGFTAGQAFNPSIDANGLVTFTPGSVITVTPPVYADEFQSSIVYTPSISSAGIVSLTSGSDSGQLRAALIDPNGAQYIAFVSSTGIAFFRAPKINIGALCTFGLFGQESVPLLVKSIQPGQDFSAQLTLIDAAPGVFDAATGIIPPFDSHITLPRTGQQPVPQPIIDNIASDEIVMVRSSDGSLVPRIVISFHLPGGAAAPAVSIELQFRLTGSTSSWERQLFAASSITEISINAVQEGLNYDIRLRSIGAAGQTSDWTTVNTYEVLGKTSPPPDVTGVSLNGEQLVWLYPDPPPDLDGFRVRVQIGNRTSWGDAMPLHDGLVSHTTFLLFRDTGQRTYLVKAVDTSGNESLNPGTFFVDYGELEFQNVAEFIDFKVLGFPGTLVNGSVVHGDFVASSDTLFWKSDGLPFWTTNAAIMWPGTFVQASYAVPITPPIQWLGGTLYIVTEIASNGYRIEYAQDSGALFWGDPSLPMWTGDANLFWSGVPSVFAPWPGQLTGYTRQTYQVRVTLFGGNVQGKLSQFQAVFDMDDITETLVNVALSADGTTRLPVTKPFTVITIVTPTIVEDGSDVQRIRVLDKDADGPLVVAVDGSNVPIDGHGDFIVKGF